jgi:hypothetical protein
MTSQNGDCLDEAQKLFIKNKVQQLGSMNAVNKFYHGDCSVNNYAHHIAQEIYPNRLSNLYKEYSRSKPKVNFPVKPKEKYEYDNEVKVKKDRNIYHCIDCGHVIPPEHARAIQFIALRCMDCQALIERKTRKEEQNGTTRRYINEGLAGSREDNKKMRARDWGDMQKRRKE